MLVLWLCCHPKTPMRLVNVKRCVVVECENGGPSRVNCLSCSECEWRRVDCLNPEWLSLPRDLSGSERCEPMRLLESFMKSATCSKFCLYFSHGTVIYSMA